jgi:hypothetical protein
MHPGVHTWGRGDGPQGQPGQTGSLIQGTGVGAVVLCTGLIPPPPHTWGLTDPALGR